MKCCTELSIYKDFILYLFLIWCLTLFDFSLRDSKFDVSSREFVSEDGEAIVGISGGKLEFWKFSQKVGFRIFPQEKGKGITN